MDVRGQLGRVPPWGWVALLGVAGLGVLVWHQWATTAEGEPSWLDPEQPAVQLGDVAEAVPASRSRRRHYPDSLYAWGGSCIGDC